MSTKLEAATLQLAGIDATSIHETDKTVVVVVVVVGVKQILTNTFLVIMYNVLTNIIIRKDDVVMVT